MKILPLSRVRGYSSKENNSSLRFLTEAEIDALLKACSPNLKPIAETALHRGKGRQIPINDRLAKVLLEVRREDQPKSSYVFCPTGGKRFYTVKQSFPPACKRAGREDFRFHDLRHTFASRLVMQGASLKAVQELPGHADMKMTVHYAHLSQEHLQDSVNLLNDLPCGKEMVNIGRKIKRASNLSIATPWYFLSNFGGAEGT
jgi:integrase